MKKCLVVFFILIGVRAEEEHSYICDNENFMEYIFDHEKMKSIAERRAACSIKDFNFSWWDLKGSSLHGVKFYDSIFNHTDVEGVDFSLSKFYGGDLGHLKAKGAIFNGVEFFGDFKKIELAHFENGQFYRTYFHEDIEFYESIFAKADFKSPVFIGTIFTKVDFKEATFNRLPGLNYSADFQSVKMRKTKFDGATLSGVIFREYRELAIRHGKSLTERSYKPNYLENVSFKHVIAQNMRFENVQMPLTNFTEADLTGSFFYNQTDFDKVVLTGAKLEGIKYKMEHFTEEEIEEYSIESGVINLDQSVCVWGDCMELVEQAKKEKVIINLQKKEKKFHEKERRTRERMIKQSKIEKIISKIYN